MGSRTLIRIAYGVARIMDIPGNLRARTTYVYIRRPGDHRSPQARDCEAIASDWNTVGNDIRSAVEQYRHEPERGTHSRERVAVR